MSGETFESLLAPNLRLVRTLVNRRLRTSVYAEDVVQNILVRAFVCRDQLLVHAKFRNWLWSIALNEINAFYRRDRGMFSLNDFPEFDIRDVASMSPLARLERKERCDWVRARVAELRPRDRAAIQLRDIEERSLREAARALRSSEAAAKATHFRARKRLAHIMRTSSPAMAEQL